MPSRLAAVLVYRLAASGPKLVSMAFVRCPTCQDTGLVTFRGKAKPYTTTCPSCRGAA